MNKFVFIENAEKEVFILIIQKNIILKIEK